METLLIKNAEAVITPKTILPHASVYVEGNIIKEVGAITRPANRIIDARGKVVIPGLINTHHHLFQILQRNIPRVQNAGLFDWLTTLYEIWRESTPITVYVSALLGISELLLTGCTTTTDHLYLFPKGMPGTLIDEEIKAAKKAGIRFYPCRGSMSLGRSSGGLPPDEITQDEETILADCKRLIENYHDPSPHSMLQISLAPCSPFSVTPNLMKEVVRMARQHGIRCHTHLAETIDEEEYCLQKFRVRPFELMEELEWVGPDIWYAHAIYLSEREIRKMGETQTGVAHCPTSNLRLGSGICPVPKMLSLDVPVGLAVDGSASNDSSNMLLEARMSLLVHRIGSFASSSSFAAAASSSSYAPPIWSSSKTVGISNRQHEPCPMTAKQALELATLGGAKVLGRDDIGEIAPGKSADLVLINMNQIGYAGSIHDPLAALLFCGDTQVVDMTIVNGKIIVENSQLMNVNAGELISEANKASKEMLEKATKRTGIDFMQPL